MCKSSDICKLGTVSNLLTLTLSARDRFYISESDVSRRQILYKDGPALKEFKLKKTFERHGLYKIIQRCNNL